MVPEEQLQTRVRRELPAPQNYFYVVRDNGQSPVHQHRLWRGREGPIVGFSRHTNNAVALAGNIQTHF